MCEFPSWIATPEGKTYWLLDKDISRAIEDGKLADWVDSTGHSAIEKVLGVKGTHREGREGLPEAFASDIRAGSCNRMAQVELSQALTHVWDLLPPAWEEWAKNYKGNLDLRSLTSLPKGCTLSAGGYLDLHSLTSLPEGFDRNKIRGNIYLKRGQV